jgi:hypothetical protein
MFSADKPSYSCHEKIVRRENREIRKSLRQEYRSFENMNWNIPYSAYI